MRAAERTAEVAARDAACHDAAWRLVHLAERVVEYREATGGHPLPKKDWREWVALFIGGGGCSEELGKPLVQVTHGSDRPGSAARGEGSAASILDRGEVIDYLEQVGEWAPPPADEVAAATDAAAGPAATAAHDETAKTKQSGQVAEQLGRVVASLAASAAAAPAADRRASIVGAPEKVDKAGEVHSGPKLDHLLRLAVVGGPCSGKTSVAQALAQLHGLQLLVPEVLVAEALAAAQEWDKQQQQRQQEEAAQQQQQQEGIEHQEQQQQQPSSNVMSSTEGTVHGASPAVDAEQDNASTAPSAATPQPAAPEAPAPPARIALGRRMAQVLRAGQSIPDALLVEAVILGIEEARSYIVPPPSTPGADGAGGKKAAAPKAAKPAAPVGAPQAAIGPLPFTGGPGRGFILDGFPATAAQAVALEKALTGLDLEAEQCLLDGASLLAPPPPDALPQLDRPLASGLDAVIVLECEDEGMAVGRALGQRVDPITGEAGCLMTT